MGHNVSECENGAQAVHAASEHCFDVVLMDIQMPVLDGLSATRRIRELPYPNNKTKIIALTGQALDSEVESALRAGVDSVISKPFSKSTLNYSLRAADQK
jgi:CheY-like chemotaxis protein